MPKRIAFIADIHGNLPAFEAVLRDIDEQQVDEMIIVGDVVNGAPFSHEVTKLIRDNNWPLIRGNHEQYVIDYVANPTEFPKPQWSPVHWTVKSLTDADIAFIQDTPTQLFHHNIMALHASAKSLRHAYYPAMSDEQVESAYGNIEQKIIIHGHTHLPTVCYWRDKIIINTGSAGLSLDGNSMPCYALVTVYEDSDRIQFQHRRVSYDMKLVENAFYERGLIPEGGIVSELHLRELQEGRIFVSPFLKHLFKKIRAQNIDFAEALIGVNASTIEPFWAYGTLDTF